MTNEDKITTLEARIEQLENYLNQFESFRNYGVSKSKELEIDNKHKKLKGDLHKYLTIQHKKNEVQRKKDKERLLLGVWITRTKFKIWGFIRLILEKGC